MKKAVKEKSKKKVKKESKKTVLARVTKLNRGPLKEKAKTKYQIAAQFIKENTGQYTKGEIVKLLHEKHGIVPGTGSTVFSAFINEKYKPQWLKETMTVDSAGKVHLE